MKTETAKDGKGKPVTLYFPENDEDIDRLNQMLRDGTLTRPGAKPWRRETRGRVETPRRRE